MRKKNKKFTLDNLNIDSVSTCGGGGGVNPINMNRVGYIKNSNIPNPVFAPNSEAPGGGGHGNGGNNGGYQSAVFVYTGCGDVYGVDNCGPGYPPTNQYRSGPCDTNEADNCDAPTAYHPNECYTFSNASNCNTGGATVHFENDPCQAVYTVTNYGCPGNPDGPPESENGQDCSIDTQTKGDDCFKTIISWEDCHFIPSRSGDANPSVDCHFILTSPDDVDCTHNVASVVMDCETFLGKELCGDDG